MKRFNKVELDFLEQKEQLLSTLCKLGLLAGFIATLYFVIVNAEQSILEDKNSIRTPINATFEWYGRIPFSAFCFFKIDVVGTVPARCTGNNYYVGQKVKLNRVTKPSGDYFYEIAEKHF